MRAIKSQDGYRKMKKWKLKIHSLVDKSKCGVACGAFFPGPIGSLPVVAIAETNRLRYISML